MHIINDLSIGGAEMMLYKLLSERRSQRFDPVVVSLIDQGALRQRIEALGIKVYTAGMSPGLPSALGLWRLVRLMRQLEPDLALGWMYHSCLAAQLASLLLRRRVPILWGIHYSVSSFAHEKRLTTAVIKLCARFSKLAAQTIFVSRRSKAQHKPLGFDLNKSCVIPNGINVTEFVPSPQSRSSVRAELGLSADALIFGMMGRYHPLKDHTNFFQAAALISRTHPEAHFLLIGRGVDHENQILRNQIEELGLARQTHLLGERNDIPRLAAAADVFSLSSACESFPNVIGEAMACEVPSVVTDVGDGAWIVGDTGRVVPPGNPRALADAWKEMIDLGPEGRMALGRAARARVIELFTLESVVARYEDVYETVLAAAEPEGFKAPAPGLVGLTKMGTTLHDSGAR
jgi:glycosyltransferase involved in cell wall biosynthesis